MTVRYSALVTVIFIREIIGPPMIGPILHDSVVMTPVARPTDRQTKAFGLDMQTHAYFQCKVKVRAISQHVL